MKRSTLTVIILFISTFLLNGCTEKKHHKQGIKGIVQSVQQGKDGYTAEIITPDGDTYYATISIPNLDNPKEFRSIKKGEIIRFEGDTIKTPERTIIKVEKLYPQEKE